MLWTLTWRAIQDLQAWQTQAWNLARRSLMQKMSIRCKSHVLWTTSRTSSKLNKAMEYQSLVTFSARSQKTSRTRSTLSTSWWSRESLTSTSDRTSDKRCKKLRSRCARLKTSLHARGSDMKRCRKVPKTPTAGTRIRSHLWKKRKTAYKVTVMSLINRS